MSAPKIQQTIYETKCKKEKSRATDSLWNFSFDQIVDMQSKTKEHEIPIQGFIKNI